MAEQLEHGRYFHLVSFSIVFAGLTALRALAKPLWYDELFTYYMSRLPDMKTTWSALQAGADLNPPLLYIATRTAHAILGDGLIATRLPAILGFLLMLVCLFRFVEFRCGAVYGFAAMLLAALSGAYAFSYEARSYGMVLGFCALSLVCWQWATEGRARPFSLAGLCLSLAAALLTHCYAVLVVIPLALGEMVRTAQRKRVDWPVWISLTVASCVVAIYLPLLAANHRFALDNVTFRPTLLVLAECYRILLNPLAGPLIGALGIVAASRRPQNSGEPKRPTGEPKGFPLYEISAALGLVLIPVFAYLVASSVSHVFMTRYGLAAVVGLSILFASFAHRYADDRTLAGAAITLLFAAWFAGGFFLWMANAAGARVSAASIGGTPPHVYEIAPEMVEKDLPFVASNGLFFLEADHYAPAAFTSRLVYLSDPELAIRYTGTDVFDRGLPILEKWFPIRARVEDYSSFVGRHRRFLAFGGFDHPLGWLTKKLLDEGAELRFLGQYHGPYGENLLLEITMPPVESALPPKR